MVCISALQDSSHADCIRSNNGQPLLSGELGVEEVAKQDDARAVAVVPRFMLKAVVEDQAPSRLPASQFVAAAQSTTRICYEAKVRCEAAVRGAAVRAQVRTRRQRGKKRFADAAARHLRYRRHLRQQCHGARASCKSKRRHAVAVQQHELRPLTARHERPVVSGTATNDSPRFQLRKLGQYDVSVRLERRRPRQLGRACVPPRLRTQALRTISC